MKKSDFYQAFSELDDKFLTESEDFTAVSAELRRSRTRTIGILASVCSCAFVLLFTAGAIRGGFSGNDLMEPHDSDSPAVQITTEDSIETSAAESSETSSAPLTTAKTADIIDDITSDITTDITDNRSGAPWKPDPTKPSREKHSGRTDSGETPDAPPEPVSTAIPVNTAPKPAETTKSIRTTAEVNPNSTAATAAPSGANNIPAGDSPGTGPDIIVERPIVCDWDDLELPINKVSRCINAAPKYYSPDLYDSVNWSYDQVVDYFGVDFTELFASKGFFGKPALEYRIILDKSGTPVMDSISMLYLGSDPVETDLYAGKAILPYDSIFQTDTNTSCTIGEVETVFYGMPGPDRETDFTADFCKDGINYRIHAFTSPENFCQLIKDFILS